MKRNLEYRKTEVAIEVFPSKEINPQCEQHKLYKVWNMLKADIKDTKTTSVLIEKALQLQQI